MTPRYRNVYGRVDEDYVAPVDSLIHDDSEDRDWHDCQAGAQVQTEMLATLATRRKRES